MSSRDIEAKKVIVVFTDDAELVNQLSDILNQHAREQGASEFVVIRQIEISELGNTATASILDLSLVGNEPEAVVASIDQIKGARSRYPLFLAGSKVDLDALMQVQDIRQGVKRRIPLPLNAEQAISVLAVQSEFETVPASVLERPSDNTGEATKSSSKAGLLVFLLVLIALGAGGVYWYLNQSAQVSSLGEPTPVTVRADDIARADNIAEELAVSVAGGSDVTGTGASAGSDDSSDQGVDAQGTLSAEQSIVGGSEGLSSEGISVEDLSIEGDSDEVEDSVDVNLDSTASQINDSEGITADTKSTGVTISDQTDSANTDLFSSEALALLEQAREALKKGYIVGPEDINALHYYRLALAIDPYATTAQSRKNQLISELKDELDLAIEQGKVGRSNSILRVITELDPFNAEIDSLKQKLRAAFVDSAVQG